MFFNIEAYGQCMPLYRSIHQRYISENASNVYLVYCNRRVNKPSYCGTCPTAYGWTALGDYPCGRNNGGRTGCHPSTDMTKKWMNGLNIRGPIKVYQSISNVQNFRAQTWNVIFPHTIIKDNRTGHTDWLVPDAWASHSGMHAGYYVWPCKWSVAAISPPRTPSREVISTQFAVCHRCFELHVAIMDLKGQEEKVTTARVSLLEWHLHRDSMTSHEYLL